jgi:sugar diacid utilization regulator
VTVPGSQAGLVHASSPSIPSNEALQRLALMVGLELARQRAEVEAESRFREDIVQHLLDENTPVLEDLWYRASLLGVDLGVRRSLVWIGQGRPIDRGLFERIRAEVRLRCPSSQVFPYQGDVVVIWGLHDGDGDRVGGQVERILQGCGGAPLTAGISAVHSRPNEHPFALREARFAQTLAVRRGGRQVVEAPRLGSYRMFAHVVGVDALQHSVAAALAPLREADRDGSGLESTLRSYLEHDRRLAATARDLHVHVNTLRYRLERIERLLATELDDPDDRFALQLALRLSTEVVGEPD